MKLLTHTQRLIAATLVGAFMMPVAFFSARAEGVTLTSLSPNPVQAGKVLQIKGTGFSGPNTVTFTPGGKTVTGGLLSTYFPVKVPIDVVPGDYTITVKNRQGQTSTNSLPVTVQAGSSGGSSGGGGGGTAGSVVLTSISPVEFSAHVTKTLSLRGSGFAGPNTVEIKQGDVVKRSYTGGLLSTFFSIKIVKDDLAPGVYDVTVKNKHGQVSNAKTLTLNDESPPTIPVRITTMAPTSAVAKSNRLIVITGSGFTATNSVHFTGPGELQQTVTVTGRSFLRSDLTVRLPNSLTPGVYHITVENVNGTSNSVDFTVQPLLQYTAFGDSLATGAYAVPLSGYVNQYEKGVETDKNLTLTLKKLSSSGSTTTQMVALVRNNTSARNHIGQSTVITWNIGSNDLRAARLKYRAKTCGGADNQDCLRAATSALKTNWSAIATEIKALAPSNAVIRTMNIYNPFVDEDTAKDTWTADGGLNDYQVMNPYFVEANSHMMAEASAQGIPIANIYEKFNGTSGNEDPEAKGYIAFDHYHPNTAGHTLIADTLKALGYAPL